MPGNAGSRGPEKSLIGLSELVRNAKLVWQLMRDGQVPLWLKSIIPASLIYLISPIDLIPDALLGLGQLDDIAVILLAVRLFLSLCPPEIVKRYTGEKGVVEGDYRVVEPEDEHPSAEEPLLEGDYRVVDD